MADKKYETTTAIPGGMAKWYDQRTLPPRRERQLMIEVLPIQKLAQKVQDDPDFSPTKDEAKALLDVNEVSVLVFLESWTLKDKDGNPKPLPTTVDEIFDLDKKLYEALITQAAKILVWSAPADFSVEAVEDPKVLTGDSAE